MAVDNFARLLLFKLLKGGSPTPGEHTTAEQYNALVDRVNNIDNALFTSGYDLMAVAPSGIRARAVAMASNDYVPIAEFNQLEVEVEAIEALFSVPGGSILQVKETDEGDNVGPVNIPHAEGDYVTEQEYSVLKNHVEDLQAMLSNSTERLVLVSQGE